MRLAIQLAANQQIVTAGNSVFAFAPDGGSLVFTGIFVAWSGGFIMIWFYAQPWFLDWDVFGTSMRELFQAHPINLSVAIWVGFLALFGIASDDGVVMATYLNDSFVNRTPGNINEIRAATLAADRARRYKPGPVGV